MVNEREFCDSIDCCFPYTHGERAAHLIHVACALSPTAVLTVVHELARAPKSANAPADVRHRLLDLVERNFTHPALSIVLPIARTMIDGDDVPVDIAIAAMNQLDRDAQSGVALNIACFSCNDVDGVADATYEQIAASWKRLANQAMQTDGGCAAAADRPDR